MPSNSAADLAQWASLPFISDAEVTEAMRSPQYADPFNEAYRQAVYAKLTISPPEATGINTRSLGEAKRVTVSAQDAVNRTEAGRVAEEQRKADEAAYGAVFGGLSIRPASDGNR